MHLVSFEPMHPTARRATTMIAVITVTTVTTATTAIMAAATILAAGCESHRLFDPETLYTSPDPSQPWTPPSTSAPGSLARRLAAVDGSAAPHGSGAAPSWVVRLPAASDRRAAGSVADATVDRASDSGTRAHEIAVDGTPAVDSASLADLIDFALRTNPATRLEWERARAAEGALGVVESRYFPTLNATGFGGADQQGMASTSGREIIRGPIVGGALELNWVLLDFGRRDAQSAAATQALVAANFTFNRTLQKVVFEVQQAYFDLDSKIALEHAAAQNLDTAATQADAVDERLRAGLATMPDSLQAQQRLLKARFDLEAARSDTISARATLARSVGLTAESWIQIERLSSLPLPDGLDTGVDLMIEDALTQRPDVQARVARVREAAQRVREAEAAFAPIVSLSGAVGGAYQDYRVTNQPGAPFPPLDRRFDASMPSYFIGLRASWLLFDGFSREAVLRQAQAERRAASAALDAARLDVSNEVWAAYFEFRAARVQIDFGVALLRASQDAYDSVFEGYRLGLRTITDLLESESGLDSARSTMVRTRADLLSASVRLAYAMGASSP